MGTGDEWITVLEDSLASLRKEINDALTKITEGIDDYCVSAAIFKERTQETNQELEESLKEEFVSETANLQGLQQHSCKDSNSVPAESRGRRALKEKTTSMNDANIIMATPISTSSEKAQAPSKKQQDSKKQQSFEKELLEMQERFQQEHFEEEKIMDEATAEEKKPYEEICHAEKEAYLQEVGKGKCEAEEMRLWEDKQKAREQRHEDETEIKEPENFIDQNIERRSAKCQTVAKKQGLSKSQGVLANGLHTNPNSTVSKLEINQKYGTHCDQKDFIMEHVGQQQNISQDKPMATNLVMGGNNSSTVNKWKLISQLETKDLPPPKPPDLSLHAGTVVKFQDLSSNNFSGQLPASVGYLEHLLIMNFSHNHLDGPLPGEFGNLRSIQILDWSFNKLSGIIPPEIGQLQNLMFHSYGRGKPRKRQPGQQSNLRTSLVFRGMVLIENIIRSKNSERPNSERPSC